MMTTVVATAVTNLSQEVPGPLKKQRAAHGSIAGDACRSAKKVLGNKDSAGKEGVKESTLEKVEKFGESPSIRSSPERVVGGWQEKKKKIHK